MFPSGSSSFTVIPNSWSVNSDNPLNQKSNYTGANYNIAQFSQANQIFLTNITLTYNGFKSFIEYGINNPGIQSAITQNAFTIYLSNSLNPSYRNLGIFSIFSQGTYDGTPFNAVPGANLTLKFNGQINNNTVNIIVSNTSS